MSRTIPIGGRLGKAGDATFNHVEQKYRDKAQQRGLSWQLSRTQFRELISQNCYLCGEPAPLRNRYVNRYGNNRRCESTRSSFAIKQAWVPINGIDRINSKQGYKFTNCRPCCSVCNMMKLDYTEFEFIVHIFKIEKFQRTKK